tara:strand:+ start:1295 stop:1468 length:174 start_codon:yes stop_codon:yes gene_type:complete
MNDEIKPIVSNTEVETAILGTVRLLCLIIVIGGLISGCGYSKECNGSPLQEYNKYQE